MSKIFHWREDAKDMSFEQFKEAHINLFTDEDEIKSAYQEVTKDSKPKRNKG